MYFVKRFLLMSHEHFLGLSCHPNWHCKSQSSDVFNEANAEHRSQMRPRLESFNLQYCIRVFVTDENKSRQTKDKKDLL